MVKGTWDHAAAKKCRVSTELQKRKPTKVHWSHLIKSSYMHWVKSNVSTHRVLACHSAHQARGSLSDSLCILWPVVWFRWNTCSCQFLRGGTLQAFGDWWWCQSVSSLSAVPLWGPIGDKGSRLDKARRLDKECNTLLASLLSLPVPCLCMVTSWNTVANLLLTQQL